MLESFFSGYLDEDFAAEHGTPEGALRAWRMDASARENQQLDREARRLIEIATSTSFDTVAAFIRRDLGSSWRPADLKRLMKLFAPVSRSKIRR